MEEKEKAVDIHTSAFDSVANAVSKAKVLLSLYIAPANTGCLGKMDDRAD